MFCIDYCECASLTRAALIMHFVRGRRLVMLHVDAVRDLFHMRGFTRPLLLSPQGFLYSSSVSGDTGKAKLFNSSSKRELKHFFPIGFLCIK